MILTHKQEVLEHIGETSSTIYDKAYQQGKEDTWADIEKIINGMTNPIDTMKIIIEQLKEQTE